MGRRRWRDEIGSRIGKGGKGRKRGREKSERRNGEWKKRQWGRRPRKGDKDVEGARRKKVGEEEVEKRIGEKIK